MARDVHYGDKSCYFNVSYPPSDDQVIFIFDLFMLYKSGRNSSLINLKPACETFTTEANCTEGSHQCEWNYNGLGMEYQVI